MIKRVKIVICVGLIGWVASAAQAGALEDLFRAVRANDRYTVVELLQRGMPADSTDEGGNTILITAIREDWPDVVQVILGAKPNVNARNAVGETALMLVALKGDLAMVRRLRAAGADVNLCANGWSPLIYAAFNGHTAVVADLEQHGGDVNAKTANGTTALMVAARNGHEETVRYLLAHGANPDVINENGASALNWSLRAHNTKIAKLIKAATTR
jgi:ankyrin repeat protein